MNRRFLIVGILFSITSASFALTGSGTQDDPYLITSWIDFDEFANNTAYYDDYIKMQCNLDLYTRTYPSAVISPDTDPCTWSYQGSPFSGTFDGAGHTISGIHISTDDQDRRFLGLFGSIAASGHVKNLNVTATIVTSSASRDVGIIAGRNEGMISHCLVLGSVGGGQYVGGIAGISTGKLERCGADCFINESFGSEKIGGLAGENNFGQIVECWAEHHVAGEKQVGGLVGANDGGEIVRSFSEAKVIGAGIGAAVGGFTGYNSGTIADCYATGEVAGVNVNFYFGGFAGWTENDITNCYFAGPVPTGVAGFLGEIWGGTLTGLFWDIDISESTRAYDYGTTPPYDITGKTTSQMQTLSTFTAAGWDFDPNDGDPAVWQMLPDESPRLVWEVNGGLSTTTIPDVVNLTQAQAESDIVAADLVVGNITQAYSSTVPAGSVIRQSPSAGYRVMTDSVVCMVVSMGPQFVPAPDLTGMTEAEAADTLTSLGLTLGIVITEYHPTVPVDIIFSQDAAPGTILLLGSPVDIIVSLGWIVLPGQGTKDDPYLISSNLELQIFADERSAARYWVTDVYTCLTSDLDLSGVSLGMIGYPNLFNGVFDGQNHVITNLRDTDHGLFNIDPNGVVMNIRLEDIEIVSSSSFAGGIAASNQGLIRNCCVSGSVTGGVNSWYTGGICGSNPGGTIEKCYWTGDVTANDFGGGIVGYNGWYEIRPGEWSRGRVRNCAAIGSVSGRYDIGGLVGYNKTEITMCYSQADVQGDQSVGGLVGRLYANDWSGKVSDCYANGDANGIDRVGGLIGEISYDFADGNDPPVKRSYSTGLVEGITDAGGLIGYNEYGEISDCFWDIETSNQPTSASGGGVGKTTELMMDPNTLADAGWDFTTPVWMISSIDYPRLIWRNPDIDDNGTVDLADYARIAEHWMETDCGICINADLTGDRNINFYDLQILANNWLDGSRISDHVAAVEFHTGWDYRFPDNASDTEYAFEIQVYTGHKVEKIEFLTPSGNLFEIPKEPYNETILPVGYIVTQWEYDEQASIDTGKDRYVWFYQTFFNNSDSLDDYGDGWYTFTVYYSNGRTQQTDVFFGVSATGQPLSQPTQEPVPLDPAHGENVTGQVTLHWQPCNDPNALFIHTYAEHEALDEEVESDGLLPKDVTSWGPLDLSEGLWVAEIAFGVLDSTRNTDGIDVVGIKYSNVKFAFTVVP